MSSVNVFIKKNVKQIAEKEKNVLVSPNIPEDKLNNAIKAFKCEDFYESILAIYDDSMFNNAKCGLVFTGEKVIHSSHGTFLYSDIESVEYIENITISDKGKENKEEFILIKTKDGKINNLEDDLTFANKKNLAIFLNKIITEFEDFKEENQLTPIAEMSEEFKKAYLKIIVNMTYINDDDIDEKELAEILLLMTRLELSKDSRFEIRTYIAEISHENLISLEKLIVIIKDNSYSSHFQSFMISLAKDMINVYFSTNDSINRNFKFLLENQSLFNLSNEEIDLAFNAVENDYKILKEDLDDTAIEKNLKELGSKATGIGVPIAAVYISGSVLGLSAAGMTSGLATLGMGGFLGLSSMATGIGVAVLLGIGAYKGVKHLTGANELDKYKTRELMLHEVIKQTQKTISLVIDDINFIVQKLNDVTLNHAEQSEKIKKLVQMMSKYQSAIKTVDNKTNYYQNSANRLQCPKELDISRLESLTSEPTQKPLFDFIVENYEEKTMMLKEDVDTEILDKMGKVFQSLGYFDMGNIMLGKASEGLEKIKGIFG